MNNTILVAAEDPDMINVLTLSLEGADYIVSVATDRVTALQLLQTKSFALVLVDISAPGISGYELIQAIRQTSNLPILVISDKGMEDDVILGLDMGADACITKPFHPLEVLAYVNAVHRRYYQLGADEAARQNVTELRVGDLILNTEAYQLFKRGKPVMLTSTELKILTKLMRSPGRIFTKAQLYECVNGAYFESDCNTMTVHISNLRAKIEDNPSAPAYIKTVRGLGYKIESAPPSLSQRSQKDLNHGHT